MDNAVKQLQKKDVITVDSMSFAKIIKESQAKTKLKLLTKKMMMIKMLHQKNQNKRKRSLPKMKFLRQIISPSNVTSETTRLTVKECQGYM